MQIHPIILPEKSYLTELIIKKHHETSEHVGHHNVLSQITASYWIVRGMSVVKRVLGRCFDCKRRCSAPMKQQMAPLPAERVTPDEPPFTNVGVDYFRPLYVKIKRSQCIRYGCLFTCLATRAVHIKHSLETSSFLSAFHRFISRRGKPAKVFSDNGTNFTAGDWELNDAAIKNWNQVNIHSNLRQSEIEWHFNPSSASHMGGVWERLIKSDQEDSMSANQGTAAERRIASHLDG